MRRNATLMRGRTLPVLTAGLIGYLIGGWHPAALRSSGDPSAADAVSLRFPQAWNDAASAPAPQAVALPGSGVLDASASAASPAASGISEAQTALLDPEPMVPQIRPQRALQTSQAPAPQESPRVQLASAEITAPAASLTSNAARWPEQGTPARPQRPAKSAVIPAPRRPLERPGYMFDDAQIASIKQRLHLTPEQEQMWPAVETALRNIAYTRAQQARGRAAPPAEIDPESVDGLKSAAVPLIMSFDDDQKQQVRELAHVMGLDQLASQF